MTIFTVTIEVCRCSMVTVIPFRSSDHNMLSYTRFSKEPVPHKRVIRKRSYKNFVKEDFIGDLSKIDWTPVLACQDIDTAESLFTELFCQILDKHAPWVCFQERKNYVPWITEETLSLIKKRDLLKHEAQKLALGRKNGQISQTEIEIWNNFKKVRNLINNRKKVEEKRYKSDLIAANLESSERT